MNSGNTKLTLFDGGMGTLLQEAGLAPGELAGSWCITHGETVRRIHESYLEAGAEIIKTNTFSTNALRVGTDETKRRIEAAVALALEAVKNAGHGRVALDIGPLGRLLSPVGDLPFEEAVTLFGDIAEAGKNAGAELVLIETMTDMYELKAAVLGAKERTALPVMASVSPDANGRLLTGADMTGVAAMLEGLGVAALGLNCGFGPEGMLPFVDELCSATALPIIVSPNAGLPRIVDGKVEYSLSPEDFASAMLEAVERGATVLGGCCGTTPAHIAALAKRMGTLAPRALCEPGRTLVCSYAKTVELGQAPVMIGERINPTGKPRLKEALRAGDMDYVLREGVKQQDAGAELLDVNAGLPDIDEAATVEKIVKSLQAVTELPLQIDSSDPSAVERALRAYNGKAMVNSVSGKRESMDAILPLVQKYGGVVVALLLDDDGIPETADGRMNIARKIIDEAAKYGIKKKDIVIDALTMTISTDGSNALVTLETLSRARALGLNTVLGVSNVSFGLPERTAVNASFLAMAVHAGLSAAIMNPLSGAMLLAFKASAALCGSDGGCKEFISAAKANPTVSAPAAKTGTADKAPTVDANPGDALSYAIERGLLGEAREEAKKALETREPIELIENTLVPALDRVGKRYERGEAYLPQLLVSADAAREAFEAVRGKLADNGGGKLIKGRILVATVRGDIHDIGKNIVKTLLQNYGYDVGDLGRDVPESAVAEEARAQGAVLVGLSALMTTTVGAMERTVALIREKAPGCKIMVGGAVLSADYAKKIGADFYCADAMASVSRAREVTEGLK